MSEVIVLQFYNDYGHPKFDTLWIATHVNRSRDELIADWDAALVIAKDTSPDEWTIEDVHSIMEEQGWKFKEAGTPIAGVSY